METGSISPLPASYRTGQLALAIVGIISLVSSTLLFLHITYKLIRLELRNRRARQKAAPQGVDLTLGLSEEHYTKTKTTAKPISTALPAVQSPEATTEQHHEDSEAGQPRRKRRQHRAANPLLVLIYNLILADISLSGTYAANIVWLKEDAVIIDSVTCRAQGWLVSFGCVISSAFLLVLSVYTYAIVIKGRRPSSRSTIAVCVTVWVVSIILACAGPVVSGKEHFFARQQFWCWIEGSNAGWRLIVYVPGFFCLTSTFALYTWTFWCLHKRSQSSRMMPRSSNSSTASENSRGFIGTSAVPSTSQHTRSTSKAASSASPSMANGMARMPTNGNPMSTAARNSGTKLRPSGHHPAFLIYPIIYSFAAFPLTLGSITPLENSTLFMTIASTLLASLGFFNALLWASTIIFSHRDDLVDTGLQYFTFMRTPSDRQYGNMIWVQGGAARSEDEGGAGRLKRRSVSGPGLGLSGGCDSPSGEDRGDSKRKWYLLGRGRNGSDSEIPLRVQPSRGSLTQARGMSATPNAGNNGNGGGIRLDVSTTVVIEDPKGFRE